MRKKEKKEKFFSSKAMLPGVILLAALLTACGAKTPGGEAAPETVISDGSARGSGRTGRRRKLGK